MNTTRTAHVTRTKLAAATAALAGLALTACGSSNGDNAGSSAGGDSKSAGGTYISADAHSGNIVIVDGSKITYLSLHASPKDKCALLTKAFRDIDSGTLAPSDDSDEDRYELESTGTINENKTAVLWDDDNGTFTGKKAGTGSIKIEPGMTTLEHIFDPQAKDDVLVPRDSDQGKAVVDQYCH
jgi:hypothetical protein